MNRIPGARIVAGATDLLPWAREGRAGDVHLHALVDVSRLAELRGVSLAKGRIHMGAATTISAFEHDPLLREQAPVLGRCAVWFADDQIREQATVGGNLINASPAGDSQPALLATNTHVTLARLEGGAILERTLPLSEFIVGPGQTLRKPQEIMTRLELDALPGYGAAFEKVGHRRSMVISTVCLAALVKLDAGRPKDRRRAHRHRRGRPGAGAPGRRGGLPDRSSAHACRACAPRRKWRCAGCVRAAGRRTAARCWSISSSGRSLARSRMAVWRSSDCPRRRVMSEAARHSVAPGEGRHATTVVTATVNGRQVTRSVPNHYRLIDFVREELKLTGNKEGCGAGECGTCSMFVNGKLVKSCLTPVQKIQGAEVETIDDLDRDHGMTVLQRAFHKCGSSQCGYCIPGMVMAATSTLRRNPFASLDEIKEGLGGNICRCTGYQKILDAVELARDVLNGSKPESALDEDESTGFIGHSTRRLDAPGKVTGAIKYAADMWMANMLHMQVLRSPHPHARIVRIDTRAASALPGVECVITSADVPGVDNFGVAIDDQPIMARGVVRYVGEAVAAVAAETPDIARAAVRAIQVEYEVLPALFDPHEAMQPGAVQLHDFAANNICKHTKIRKGDVEAGLKEADLIVEETYQTAPIEHAYLEPEAGLAYVESDGCVTVQSPSQNITHHRHMLARILGRPINKVRMIMSTVGGGFGGKEDMIYQGMLALAAIKTRRPVRYVFTREESFIASAKRHPVQSATPWGSSATAASPRPRW